MSKSLEKALMLVDLIAKQPLTLAELANLAGVPRSTAHRLATQLVEHSILNYDGHRYALGFRLMELGELVRRHLKLPTIAQRPVEDLAERTGETVHLGQLADSEVVYLYKENGRRGLQMASYIGLRTPLQFTAMGKAIVAFQPREYWGRVALNHAPRTRNSITTKAAFLKELNEIRKKGYAVDCEENEVGIRCLAVPIFGPAGVTAAVSISGAAIFITESREQELVLELWRCARVITRAHGGNEWQDSEDGRPLSDQIDFVS